jgi:hypothetical protein
MALRQRAAHEEGLFSDEQMVAILRTHRAPLFLRSDNGPAFTAGCMQPSTTD